jgi:hypothetical protein
MNETAHEAVSDPRWHYCLTEPCEWLAMWIGPHRHLLKDDGRIGTVVERVMQQQDGAWSRTVVERVPLQQDGTWTGVNGA